MARGAVARGTGNVMLRVDMLDLPEDMYFFRIRADSVVFRGTVLRLAGG